MNGYRLALPASATVTAHCRLTSWVSPDARHSARPLQRGFDVRSLAQDLGARLGTGGHLSALRRTRSGQADIAVRLPLEALERDVSTGVAGRRARWQMLPRRSVAGAHARRGQTRDSWPGSRAA